MYGDAVQITLDVDAQGQMTRQTVRTMLRATRPERSAGTTWSSPRSPLPNHSSSTG